MRARLPSSRIPWMAWRQRSARCGRSGAGSQVEGTCCKGLAPHQIRERQAGPLLVVAGGVPGHGPGLDAAARQLAGVAHLLADLLLGHARQRQEQALTMGSPQYADGEAGQIRHGEGGRVMVAVADQHEGLLQEGGNPEKLGFALGFSGRRQQQDAWPVAVWLRARASGISSISSVSPRRRAALQHLDGHAARCPLMERMTGGNVRGHDDHGVGPGIHRNGEQSNRSRMTRRMESQVRDECTECNIPLPDVSLPMVTGRVQGSKKSRRSRVWYPFQLLWAGLWAGLQDDLHAVAAIAVEARRLHYQGICQRLDQRMRVRCLPLAFSYQRACSGPPVEGVAPCSRAGPPGGEACPSGVKATWPLPRRYLNQLVVPGIGVAQLQVAAVIQADPARRHLRVKCL